MSLEKRTTHPKVEQPPAIDETEVFSRLHHPLSDFNDPAKLEEFAHHLGEDLTHCEAYPFYRDYIEGRIPTLDTLGRTVENLRARVADEVAREEARGAPASSTEDLRSHERLLAGRIGNLRRNVVAYVQSVARFHEMKDRVKYSDPDWRVSEIEKVDTDRRRIHNNLLKALNDLIGQAQFVVSEDLVKAGEIVLWDRNTDVRALEEQGKLVLFGRNVIADRDYIRDWAIAADIHLQMQGFESRQKELESSPENAEGRRG